MPHLPPQTWSSSRISLLICAGVTYSLPSRVCTTSSCFSEISFVTISIQFRSDNLSTAEGVSSYSTEALAKITFKLTFQTHTKHKKYNEVCTFSSLQYTFSDKDINVSTLLVTHQIIHMASLRRVISPKLLLSWTAVSPVSCENAPAGEFRNAFTYRIRGFGTTVHFYFTFAHFEFIFLQQKQVLGKDLNWSSRREGGTEHWSRDDFARLELSWI